MATDGRRHKLTGRESRRLNLALSLSRLTSTRDRPEIADGLIASLPGSLGYEQAVVYGVREEGNAYRVWPLAASMIGTSVLGVPFPAADQLWDAEGCPGLPACLASGVPAGAEVAGVCHTYFPVSSVLTGRVIAVLALTTPRPIRAETRQLVEALVAVFRNHLNLLDYGQRDALTGLLNRKTFDERFNRRDHILPPGTGRWIGVVDIDHFKRVNDTHGHLYGDEVLLWVANTLRSRLRDSDDVFRFGGEEFAVLLERVQPEHAPGIFERLRAAVAERPFGRVGQVTVSIGFSAIRSDDIPSSAFERADRALYLAKSLGRNQVCDHAAETGAIPLSSVAGDIDLFTPAGPELPAEDPPSEATNTA